MSGGMLADPVAGNLSNPDGILLPGNRQGDGDYFQGVTGSLLIERGCQR